MAVVTGQFDNLYTRKIDDTFFEAWDEEPEQWPKFARDEKSNQHNETYQSFAGTVNWRTKQEMANAEQDAFNLADLIVTEHTPYGVEIILSREFIADSKYEEVTEMTRDAGRAGRSTVEENTVTLLDNAFTVNQYDSFPMISASHPFRKTGKAGVQSNLATGPMNDTTIKAGLNLFNDVQDEAGKKISMDANKFITHKDNQWNVATIFESTLRSGTANNDKNPLPDLEYVFSTYMESKTAWFLQSKQHKLIHFYRERPEFIKRKYMNPNGSQSWDGYFRDSTVVRNWRGMVGSTGL